SSGNSSSSTTIRAWTPAGSTRSVPVTDVAPHRAVLEHVLSLIVAAPCGESLVLRGSTTMLAWAGPDAREPRDLDFVVRPLAGPPLDDLDPYPYVDSLDTARLWPETAHGAGRPQLWTFEDLDTGGLKPRVPPEGLRWMAGEETALVDRPHEDIVRLI